VANPTNDAWVVENHLTLCGGPSGCPGYVNGTVSQPNAAAFVTRGFADLPLSRRKTNPARLLARRPDGIFVAPLEPGEIGPDLFRAACNVSKRRDRPYRGGRQKYWIKVNNRKHPAIDRVMDSF
jgi:hypothetical protein